MNESCDETGSRLAIELTAEPDPRFAGVVGGAATRAEILTMDQVMEKVVEKRKKNAQDQLDRFVQVRDFRLEHPNEFEGLKFSEEDKGSEWEFFNEGSKNEIETEVDNLARNGSIEERLDNLETFNTKILAKIQEYAQDTEKDKEAYAKIKEALDKLNKGKEGDIDALNNAAIADFLNGKEVLLTEPLFNLRTPDANGKTTTNILSWEMFINGKYASDFRYYFRAMMGKFLMTTGSKNEILNATGVLERLGLINDKAPGGLYEGADRSTIQADVQYCLLQNKEAAYLYSSGIFKSQALRGNGYAEQGLMDYADKVPSEIQDIIFDKEVAKNNVGKDRVDRYEEINNAGKGRLTAMVKWLYAVQKGEGMGAIEKLDGDYLDTMTDAVRIIVAVQKVEHKYGADSSEYDNCLKMLKIEDKKAMTEIIEQMGAIFDQHNNSQDRARLVKGSINGRKLNFWLANASGRLRKLRDNDSYGPPRYELGNSQKPDRSKLTDEYRQLIEHQGLNGYLNDTQEFYGDIKSEIGQIKDCGTRENAMYLLEKTHKIYLESVPNRSNTELIQFDQKQLSNISKAAKAFQEISEFVNKARRAA